MLPKAFSKSMKSRRPGICFVFILDDAFYEPDIFPDSSIFQKTRYTQLVIRSMEIEKQFAFDNNNLPFFRKK